MNWNRSNLPQPTRDEDRVKHDIETWGYGLLEGALEDPLLGRARERILEQARAELTLGHAFEDGGPTQQWGEFLDENGQIRAEAFTAANGGVNQRVWLLPNKGQVFLDVLEHEPMRPMIEHVLGTDGRVWHGTGENRSDESRIGMLINFCGPQYRPQMNFTLAMDPAILANASDRLKTLFGLKVWWGYGRTGNPTTQFVDPAKPAIGELR